MQKALLGEIEMLIERIVNTLIHFKLPEPKRRWDTIRIPIVLNSDPVVTRNPECLILVAKGWEDNGRRFLKWEFLLIEREPTNPVLLMQYEEER